MREKMRNSNRIFFLTPALFFAFPFDAVIWWVNMVQFLSRWLCFFNVNICDSTLNILWGDKYRAKVFFCGGKSFNRFTGKLMKAECGLRGLSLNGTWGFQRFFVSFFWKNRKCKANINKYTTGKFCWNFYELRKF
jgi:hypothetical protein